MESTNLIKMTRSFCRQATGDAGRLPASLTVALEPAGNARKGFCALPVVALLIEISDGKRSKRGCKVFETASIPKYPSINHHDNCVPARTRI